MSENTLFGDLPRVTGKTISFGPIRYPIWTENKAKLIARYLYYFVLVTKHGAYIDGFAGPQEADKPQMWAAKLVLETEPKWLRQFFLCDAKAENARQLEALKTSQPPRKSREPTRTIEIYEGDFNSVVDEILASGKIKPKVATFCLLDQRTFECHWRTVRALAQHKTQGTKIELFYFLGTGWLGRALAAQKDAKVLQAWWERDDWAKLRSMEHDERVTLFCRRFKDELGYKHVYPWPIFEKRSGGRIMYFMIHASDHDEAPPLMARAYRKATGRLEPLQNVQITFDFDGKAS